MMVAEAFNPDWFANILSLYSSPTEEYYLMGWGVLAPAFCYVGGDW